MSARSNYVRKKYSETTAAYMAGILDGEGCLYIGNYSGNRKNGDKHFQTNISISSTDECLVDWLYNTFGGYRGQYTIKQMSKNGRKQVYRWQCSSDRMLHICEITLPYLVIKTRQAEILIEMRKTYCNLHNIKGKQRVQNLPKEILDLRQSLMDELRSLHNRTYSYKKEKLLAPCCPTD
jgi:hypothetical protein